ncbi:DBH-like monooxygenase protein 2 homolog [Kryptolebias marmoratus]|uniref:DBH-like monooxygenase protein 2 homolog n=1 Tax=Kryptolebias marmoratus TaxID=37003 RepID=UPI0007F911EB|nr:DBH-like monooxygenase protein 2 homolog [Kryptolebias marmoratus]
MSALLSFLFISLAWTKATWASDYNLTHTVSLDAKVSLKWGFNDPKGNITFQLKISTTGWVGFGLGLHDNMVNADIVVGGLGSNGSYFADFYSTANGWPSEDKMQNYDLLSVTEENGETTMTFQRLMDTGDDKDFPITDKTIYLIYAYGTTDVKEYHGTNRRGHKQVNLLKSAASRLCTSWTVNTGGIMLLFWIAII